MTPRHPECDDALLRAIAGDCDSGHDHGLEPLIGAIRARHGDAVRAVVYYGSCLRSGDPYEGLVDLYVIVDRYRNAHASRVSALANRLLPPNVYYLEADGRVGRLRCKYAVLSLADLRHGVSHGWLSSLWGRFAQPMAIVYADDESIHDAVRTCCGQAVVTLLNEALPALASPARPAEAFGRVLALSYGGELRAESGVRGAHLADRDSAEYARRLHAARSALAFVTEIGSDGRLHWSPSARQIQRARHRWRLRGPAGRGMSVVRLSKACFTFDNAVDYAAWKLERHTGVAIEVTPRLRNYPLIYGWPVLWRLYRRGVLR